jgi:hypothetical protein
MPQRSNQSRCNRPGCRAPIMWVKHYRTNKAAPIDATAAPGGNIAIDEESFTYSVVPEAEREGRMLYTNHWATCLDPPEKKR